MKLEFFVGSLEKQPVDTFYLVFLLIEYIKQKPFDIPGLTTWVCTLNRSFHLDYLIIIRESI